MPKKNHETTGRDIIIMWIGVFIGSGIAIYLASKWFPTKVVLGTRFITPLWAIFHSVGVLATIDVAMVPVIESWAKKNKKTLTDKDWMMEYFLINAAALWIIARFANNLGLGLSSWTVAIMLGIVVNFAQGFVMTFLMGKNKK